LSQVLEPKFIDFSTFTARCSTATDPQVLVGHPHGALQFDLFTLILCVADDLVGDLLDAGQLCAADRYAELLVLLLDIFAFFLAVSHLW
jgi:hypothetical protein